MKEPISLRVSDSGNPKRGIKFKEVLRALIDAYTETEGNIDFPVKLHTGADAETRKRQRVIFPDPRANRRAAVERLAPHELNQRDP